MAVIGIFTKDGAGYTGTIETLTFKATLTLEPNTNKKSDKAPDFRIHHKADEFTSEIGAAWTKTAKCGSQSMYRSASTTTRAWLARSTAASSRPVRSTATRCSGIARRYAPRTNRRLGRQQCRPLLSHELFSRNWPMSKTPLQGLDPKFVSPAVIWNHWDTDIRHLGHTGTLTKRLVRSTPDGRRHGAVHSIPAATCQ